MHILPSGRKRIMEAQFPQGVGESNDWGVDELGPSNEYPLEEVPSMPPQTEIPDKSQEVPEEKSDGKPDLNEYLFKKLLSPLKFIFGSSNLNSPLKSFILN